MKEKIKENSTEIILYVFFGALTLVVNIVTYIICTEKLGIDVLIANIIAWLIAVIFAYGTNRVWVFHSKTNSMKNFIMQMLCFACGRCVTLILEEGFLWIFIVLVHWNSVLVKCLAQILVILLNYIISKLWIFKK